MSHEAPKTDAPVARVIFVALLLSYVGFSVLEEFAEGFVSRYFSLNWLLAAVLVSAFPLFGSRMPEPQAGDTKRRAWLLIVFSSLAALALVFLSAGTLALEWRILLSLFGGVLTAAILSVLFEDS